MAVLPPSSDSLRVCTIRRRSVVSAVIRAVTLALAADDGFLGTGRHAQVFYRLEDGGRGPHGIEAKRRGGVLIGHAAMDDTEDDVRCSVVPAAATCRRAQAVLSAMRRGVVCRRNRR